MPEPICPPDMVKVTPREVPTAPGDPYTAYCVDRYESMLVASDTAERIPPYYMPSRKGAAFQARFWENERFEMGEPAMQQIGLPGLPPWMLQRDFEPKAMSRRDVVPNGHVTGEQALKACRLAGKRLCTEGEWWQACRGESVTKFPYGSEYIQSECNVFREGHPAAILHANASIGHTDPRLNRVRVRGKRLLRKTGATPGCASHWGDDALWDMVGNIDEWLADPEGAFAGGFYARSAKSGCDWIAKSHPFHYGDYSTGVRCCGDLPVTRTE